MPEPIYTFRLWGEELDVDPDRYGICECGQLTAHPDVTTCDSCTESQQDQ